MNETGDSLHKVPPQNTEAEQSVLGGILIENEALNRVVEILNYDDFYRESHRKIFKSMIALSEKNEPSDLITLTNELKYQNLLEEIGGASYLASLIDSVPTAAKAMRTGEMWIVSWTMRNESSSRFPNTRLDPPSIPSRISSRIVLKR
jgi:replicative DNA helicase